MNEAGKASHCPYEEIIIRNYRKRTTTRQKTNHPAISTRLKMKKITLAVPKPLMA